MQVDCRSADEDAASAQRFGPTLGQAFLEETPPRVELAPAVCHDLLRPRLATSADRAIAASVFAHELGHVLYGPCERSAERYALGHWQALERLLGLGPPTLEAEDAVTVSHGLLPDAYRSPC